MPTLTPRRGSQKRQRIKSLQIALTPEEFIVACERAAAAGLTASSYGRALLLGAPGPRARRSPPLNAELLAHAVAQLNKAGSNLNQIARILNSGKAVGSREAVEALTDTRAAVVQILDIVGRKDRL
ncbi:MAG: MobC family plasmid mobilization relaxosome protein [Acidobacteriota bacterium]|nr:MobC family plasmid mobilization relaxosome protein [Acidobacteriota bacterium]